MNDLTHEQIHFARVMFQNKILVSDGQRYEDLVVSVLTRRNPGFRPIKPQGRIGDQGNDGFIKEEGKYYQIYAPEQPQDKVTDAVNKAKDDFEKLKSYWEADASVTEYRFTFNDKFKGAYPEIEHALSEMKEQYALTVCEPFLAKDLEREFMLLPRDEMHAVLGSVIPRRRDIRDIDFAALTEILKHLVDNPSPISGAVLVVPNFDKKITFNGIEQAGCLLAVGNFQNAAVEQYFNRHGQFAKTEIRDSLASRYQAAKEDPATGDTPHGDTIFFRLLESIVPNASKEVQDAAIVLISYFFETCDVFEDPDQ